MKRICLLILLIFSMLIFVGCREESIELSEYEVQSYIEKDLAENYSVDISFVFDERDSYKAVFPNDREYSYYKFYNVNVYADTFVDTYIVGIGYDNYNNSGVIYNILKVKSNHVDLVIEI